MIIGIDCRSILNPSAGEKAGVGYYTYNLVKALTESYPEENFVLFFEKSASLVAKEFHRPHVEVKFLSMSGFKQFFPFLYSHYLVAEDFKHANLDLLIAPANVLPLFYEGKSMLVVHDLAIYKHPEWFPGGQDFATRVVVPSSVKRAAKIISVSRATKKDLAEVLKVPAEKIDVVYEGVDVNRFKPQNSDDVKKRFGINKPYILTIGTLSPRKNIKRLVEAFAKINGDYQLVVAGGRGWKDEDVFEAGRSLDNKIIFTDYVSDADIPKLVAGAEVFVMPSLYEGFGLPVLEALASGTLAASSDRTSLPEVGGEVVKYFDPENTSDITKAISELLNLPEPEKNNLKERGRAWANHFSWHRCAEEIYTSYLTI